VSDAISTSRETNKSKKNKEKVKVGDRWGPGVQTVDPASSEQREMENKVNRTQGEKKNLNRLEGGRSAHSGQE